MKLTRKEKYRFLNRINYEYNRLFIPVFLPHFTTYVENKELVHLKISIEMTSGQRALYLTSPFASVRELLLRRDKIAKEWYGTNEIF